jgi:hypothetical protein
MLPPGQGAFVVRGTLPADAASLKGQRLRIESRARTLAEAALPRGDFEVRVPFQSGEAFPLTLLADRSRIGRDLRRRSYILRSLQWERASRLST